MKNFSLFAIVASLTLVLSSCSSNETLLPEEQSVDLLKSFKVQRNADGAYSLDYDLNDNATSDKVIDESTNTSNIYLYSSANEIGKKVTQNLEIGGEQLKVGFINANSGKAPQITIVDDNIRFAKNNNEKLTSYSISSNEDGTYTLDFTVNNKVKVDFVYNEEIKTYEVHLENGKSSETNYSRVLEKGDGELLKLDFVNHNEAQGRIDGDATLSLVTKRKPRIIVDDPDVY